MSDDKPLTIEELLSTKAEKPILSLEVLRDMAQRIKDLEAEHDKPRGRGRPRREDRGGE